MQKRRLLKVNRRYQLLRNFIRIFLVLFILCVNGASAQRLPFPQSAIYSKGSIKPSYITQKQLNAQVLQFYKEWKGRYVKQACNIKDQKYIWFEKPGIKQCVSEGQGYGMMIVAIMAGADVSAQQTFNALYRYYAAHPARKGQKLMAWAQDKYCKSTDHSSATDGDLDIAYALILADKQWGSKGKINYLKAAKDLLSDVMRYEINPVLFNVLISNGAEHDSDDYFDMRSSDFMPAHFRAFLKITGDVRWQKVLDSNYKLFAQMQQRYSPYAGLLPDFIVNINKHAKPAKANYLESKYDGAYNYNACRVPWRVATDYLLYGDVRAKAICDKMNTWLRQTTSNNPDNISAGYSLAGNDLPERYFEALSFIGPFAVSAMVNSKNQQWLNSIHRYLADFKLKDYDYYDNSIKLLSMLMLSGNYPGI